MDIADLKRKVEELTGIPVALLDDETTEEAVIARARTLLSFLEDNKAAWPKTTREQFSEWLDGTPPNREIAALDELEDSLRPYSHNIRDGGEVTGLPDGRSAKAQFEQWFGERTAYDPFRKEF